MACGQLPSFSPIHNSVKGEQFRCYKSPKGERASERLTGSTVAEGDLQHPATVFLFFFILQGHPASLTWAIPTSVSLFFLLNFPFLRGFFSLALCVWLRGLYPISFTSFFFFFFKFAPPLRQLNSSYSVNLSCSFSAFLFAVAYPHLSLPLCFPPLCQLTPLSFSPSLSRSHQPSPSLPPSLGSTHLSLPFPR